MNLVKNQEKVRQTLGNYSKIKEAQEGNGNHNSKKETQEKSH